MSVTTAEKTAVTQAVIPVAGMLAVGDNNAFVRVNGYAPSPDDIQVPLALVRKYGLRGGDHVTGTARPRGRGNAVLATADRMPSRPNFDSLTPLFPTSRLNLSGDPI